MVKTKWLQKPFEIRTQKASENDHLNTGQSGFRMLTAFEYWTSLVFGRAL
jgi:hypothetical protein